MILKVAAIIFDTMFMIYEKLDMAVLELSFTHAMSVQRRQLLSKRCPLQAKTQMKNGKI
jgi:hypothetical protein